MNKPKIIITEIIEVTFNFLRASNPQYNMKYDFPDLL